MTDKIEQIIRECDTLSGKEAHILFTTRGTGWRWLAYTYDRQAHGNTALEAAESLLAKVKAAHDALEKEKGLLAQTLGIHP